MNEPTHAPGWRGRPRRYGPIEAMHEEAERLERAFRVGCFSLTGLTLAIAGYAWLADALAGHL
jgi:hypothetical protein